VNRTTGGGASWCGSRVGGSDSAEFGRTLHLRSGNSHGSDFSPDSHRPAKPKVAVGHTTQVPHETDDLLLDRTPPAELTPAERAAAVAALLAIGLLRHLHPGAFPPPAGATNSQEKRGVST
jgi:hypothetical protein